MSDLVKLSNDVITLEIDPKRGNIFTKCTAYGKEWIYIDQENYKSTTRPRCGCPILFPYMGALDDDTLLLDGERFPALLHGIVHTNQWKVDDVAPSFASFSTQSNDESFKYYPFLFNLVVNVTLINNEIKYEMVVKNRSDKVMPCDIGFHPFFRIKNLSDISLLIDGKELSLTEERVEQIKTTGYLVKGVQEIVCEEYGEKIKIECLENLPNVFLWSGKPEQFIVIEPWTSYRNAINENQQYFNIKPNEECKVVWGISFNKM